MSSSDLKYPRVAGALRYHYPAWCGSKLYSGFQLIERIGGGGFST